MRRVALAGLLFASLGLSGCLQMRWAAQARDGAKSAQAAAERAEKAAQRAEWAAERAERLNLGAPALKK